MSILNPSTNSTEDCEGGVYIWAKQKPVMLFDYIKDCIFYIFIELKKYLKYNQI